MSTGIIVICRAEHRAGFALGHARVDEVADRFSTDNRRHTRIGDHARDFGVAAFGFEHRDQG